MSGRDDHIERLQTGELELGITDALQKYAYLPGSVHLY